MAPRRLPMALAALLAVPGGLAPQVARLAPGAAQVFKGGDPAWTGAVDAVPGGDRRTGILSRVAGGLRYAAPAAPGAHLLTLAQGQGRPAAWAAVLVGPPGADPPAGAAVDVKAAPYLARGDGAADDTFAIQRAIDAVAGTGGTVLVPPGTYRINTVQSGNRGLVVSGSMTLRLAEGATLQAIPTPSGKSSIITVAGARDVAILGGTLAGDRDRHPGRDGEWGMGLAIDGSRRVRVARVTARDCWGDGFYVTGSGEVELEAVQALGNRRNGLSIVGCDGITVRGSVFRGSQGTPPEDGLDIEPNQGQTVTGALITGNLFADNAGAGMETGVPDALVGRAFATQVTVDANVFVGNGHGSTYGSAQMGLRVSNCPGAQVTRNVLVANRGMGIHLRLRADGCLVADNTVAHTAGDGINQAGCRDNRITGNRVLANTGHGILSIRTSGGSVSGNTLSGNGLDP